MRKKSKTGFTLIELVMVILILGIVAGIGGPLVGALGDSFTYMFFRKDLSENADVALRRMRREIPRLQDDTSVYTAGATTYRFINIDGATIEFNLNGTNLERFDGTNTDVLAPNISTLTFTYLDENLATIATPQVNPSETDIRYIQIDMTTSLNTNTINYTTRLRIRNVVHLADIFP